MDKNTINILIIEDSKTDALLIKEAFKTIENVIFKIKHIYNGNDINNQLNKFIPHIILLDLDLLGKHGLQILQEIKISEQLRHIPVIIYTSSDSSEDITQSYQEYASGYIIKGFNFDEIITKLSILTNYWAKLVQLPINED